MAGRPLLATQKQILAVYKAAKQAGIHVEVRIEGGVVRFIPCELGDTLVDKLRLENKGRGYF